MLRRHAMLAIAGSALPATLAATAGRALAASPYYPTYTVLQLGTVAKTTSQILLQRSRNRYTRVFAGLEIVEQTAAAQALTSDVTPSPPALTAAQQAIIDKIRTVSAASLDYTYVTVQIQGHQALLAIQEKALRDFGAHPTYDIVHVALLLQSNIVQHLTLLQDAIQQVA